MADQTTTETASVTIPPPPDPDANVPSPDWKHHDLYVAVRNALYALPAYFKTDLNISGIPATDLQTFNTSLGATIETQAVETLNQMRTVWDAEGRYADYMFVRQAQCFPDVILNRIVDIPLQDGGNNFGRLARTDIMEDFKAAVFSQQTYGIPIGRWREFFAIFSETKSEDQIARELKTMADMVVADMVVADMVVKEKPSLLEETMKTLRDGLIEVVRAFATVSEPITESQQHPGEPKRLPKR